jgi:hypothetical protein
MSTVALNHESHGWNGGHTDDRRLHSIRAACKSAPRVLSLLTLLSAIALAAPAGAQTAISCGQTLAGDISVAGEQDTYTFSATAGEAVQIAAINTSGSLSAVAELRAPDNTLLGYNGTGNGWTSSIPLPTTGTYSIIVRDFMLPGTTGSYVVSLQFTTGRCATSIGCGQLLSGSLGIGELDSFSFSGTVGVAVQIAAINTSGSLSAVAELFGPTGSSLGYNGTGNGWTSSISLPSTGTYTVIVHDFQRPDTAGAYNIGLQFTTGRCGAAIACGQLLSGSLGIGELDSFSFSGTVGETVQIAAINTSGSLSAVAELFGPTGSSLGYNGTGNGWTSSISLPSTGTYTVIVHDFQRPDTAGAYNIGLQFTTGRCGAAIACGQLLSGSLRIGELDSFSFSGTVGEAVQIAAINTSGSLSAVAELFGPTGSSLGYNGTGNARTNPISLPSTGTYTVIVHDFQRPDTAGSYNVDLEFPTGRCGAAIECGRSQSGSLAVGEMNAYSFTATAGEAVVITTSRTSGTVSAVAALYGPTGTLIGDNGLGNGTSAMLPLATTGTYTVVVCDWSTPTESGDYDVRINCIGPSTSFVPLPPCRVFDTRVATGDTAGAPVLSSGEHRLFTVTNTCGIPANAKAISVNLTVVGAQANGDLRVIGGDLSDTSTSVLSIPVSRARANNATVQLSRTGNGQILVINATSGSAHVILDVNGYFQ